MPVPRLTTLIAAMLFIGCASGNGDPSAGDPAAGEPAAHADHSTKSPGDETPAFDASFDESSDAGATPPGNTNPPPPSGDQCIDKDDEGASENLGKKLPEIDACDSSQTSLKGVANGATDVDFFSIHAK